MTRVNSGRLEILWLQRAVPVRMIDIGGAHPDAMLARIAHELRRGIEAERLRVQHGGAEHIRIEAFQPAGSIDQQRERGGMALGKAIFAEPLDLLEAMGGEFPVIS